MMDWGHGILLLILVVGVALSLRKYYIFRELANAALAVRDTSLQKDKQIERLQNALTKEVDLVVDLQQKYSEYQDDLEVIRREMLEPLPGIAFGGIEPSSFSSMQRAMNRIGEVREHIKEVIEDPVRPIRFRRAKDDEQQKDDGTGDRD
jgi:hypothetical protein